MEIGIVGLGKMGANMARRMIGGGHRVVVANRSPGPIKELEGEGAVPAWSYAELAQELRSPRAVWMMVPAGQATEDLVAELTGILEPGDLLVDGANSFYKDSMRRAEELQDKGLEFVDAGVSGGVWGLEQGYSLMVGGSGSAIDRIRPALQTLAPAPDRGWGHVGPSGAGHFVKMVHNGIEYGMMQAYAEGFEILSAREEFGIDTHQVAEVWREGSVVRSWLLDLTAAALKEDPGLEKIEGWVDDSGEGRWTVAEAIEQDVPAPVITLSLMMRLVSRQEDSFAARILAAMRNQFGGHSVRRRDSDGS